MRIFNPGFIIRPPIRTTWSNTDKSSNIVLTGGLLTATSNVNGDGGTRATVFRNTGKWYFEISSGAHAGGDTGGGLAAGDPLLPAVAASAQHAIMQYKGGNVYVNGGGSFNGLNIDNMLGVAYDADAHLAWLTTDGTHWNSTSVANSPAGGTGGVNVSAFDSAGLFPCVTASTNGDAWTGNFGASSFTYSIPVGFSAWNG